MRSKFDEQLELLNVELIKMGSLCEGAISSAVKALLENDRKLAEGVFSIDSEIDQMERDIESLCMKLLLQQQPVASDLRLISAAIKMISDMERIGDQAADIAEISEFISVNEADKRLIGDMSNAAISMVTQSIDSFVGRDIELAYDVMKADDTVDGLFDRVKDVLITTIAEFPDLGGYCLDLLMIAKYLERIGDHATNIAEWVEFSITGLYKGEPL